MFTPPPGIPAMPSYLPIDAADNDVASYKETDGTDEGAERALDALTPEDIAAFIQQQVEAQLFKAYAPLMARIQEAESRAHGGILGRANTVQRENGSQLPFPGGDGSGSARTTDLTSRLVQISGEANPSPRILAVSLSKVLTSTPAAASNHLIYAEIVWGSGKAKNKVRIDYKQGQRVTVDGSYVEVNGIYSSSVFPAGGHLLGPNVLLGAQVIEGSLGIPTNGATYTSGRYTVAAAGFTPDIPLPSFAATINVIGSIAGGPYVVNFNSGSTTPGAGGPLTSVSVTANTPIQIPNGAESVTVKNGGGVSDNMTIVFGLNF